MKPSPEIDARHMARALSLARKGLYSTDPNPRVGCVLLASNGEVCGEGYHHRAGQPHAEVLALRQAGNRARGGRAYVTLEPCGHHGKTPPCAEALIDAGIASVVCAMQDPNPLVAGAGIERLRQAGIMVESGLMQAEAETLNIGFVSRMRRQRAWVRLKIAQSLDGRSAMASGESQWITGPAARQDVHKLRARSSAIITGIGSVLLDNPSMTARAEGIAAEDMLQPKRIVLDSQLQISANASIVDAAAPSIVYCSDHQATLAEPVYREKAAPLLARGVEVRRIGETGTGHLDVVAIVNELSQRDACNEILVEAGARLSGSMLQQKLVDELWVYLAPILMGSSARPSFQLALQTMLEKQAWRFCDSRVFGSDIRLRLRPASDSA